MSLVMKVAKIQTQGSGRVMPGIGDPGFFGDIFKKVVSVGRGALTGGVAGAIDAAFGGGRQTTVSNGVLNQSGFQQQPQGQPPRPIIDINLPFQGKPGTGVTLFSPFGPTSTSMTSTNGNGIGCATGFHPNKSDYFLKNGTFIQKGSRCVKNRRRNPLNPRAMDRAISRIVSGKKASSRMGRITIRKSCK